MSLCKSKISSVCFCLFLAYVVAIAGSTIVNADASNSVPSDVRMSDEPNFMNGLGKVFGGLVFEVPRTVLEATFENPPVVGTMMGFIGGIARAFSVAFSGFQEMSADFDPWGIKKR